MQKELLFLFLLFLVLVPGYFVFSLDKQQVLEKGNQSIFDYSKHIQPFYALDAQESWRDITAKILSSPYTHQTAKEAIEAHHRRIIVFQYPSDGLKIKGFISFTPQPAHHPLLVVFRWGNQNFALMNPAINLTTYGDYTVVSSTLRGGVSEGQDEFGGADVHDMKNLIAYLPTLAQQLGISLDSQCMYFLGPSRGGLEMFLTLARYPHLQNRVTKAVALSALLDLRRQIQDRPADMKAMFIQQFGLKEGPGEKEWVAQRDPLQTIPYLKKNLPILIIQGTDDPRVSLAEGRHMVRALQQTGHQVDYWEVKGGNHTLTNTPRLMEHIAQWLERDSIC
jgi:dipeptidyl aminopeptidase/acylaminoacyl peptidase